MTTTTRTRSNYEYAQLYASLGLRVYPLRPTVKNGDGNIRCSCSTSCGHPGKHPLIDDYLNKASTKLGALHQWFKDKPEVGIGVALHGLLAIDFDVRKSYEEAGTWQDQYGDDLPPTVMSWSGRGDGGMHMLYRLPEGAIITKAKQNALLNGRITEAVEFKVNAGALVLPPSMHEAGNFYRWEHGWGPHEREIAVAPWWLIALVQDAIDATSKSHEGNVGCGYEASAFTEVDNDEFLDAQDFTEHVAAYTGGVILKAGKGYLTNCPVHGDEKPSLTIGMGREGQTLTHCQTNICTFDEILNEVDIQPSQLYPTRRVAQSGDHVMKVESGAPLTTVEGIEPLIHAAKKDVRVLANPENRLAFQLAGEDDIMRMYINQQLHKSGIRLDDFWTHIERVQTITNPLSPIDIIALLESAPQKRLVDRMLPASGFSLCAARPKVGKSTLMRNLIASILRGGQFLGRDVLITGPVLYYCLEETLYDSWNHLTQLGVNEESPLILRRGSVSPSAFRVMLRQDLDAYKPVLVVVDPMVRVLGVEDFNAYGGVDRAMTPLVEMTRERNAHIMMVHHCNKMSANLDLESVLGSTAFAGAVDAAIIMGRDADTEARYVRTFTRYLEDEPIARSEVILDKDTGTTMLGQTAKPILNKRETVVREKVKQGFLLYASTGTWLPRKELYEVLGLKKDAGKSLVDKAIELEAAVEQDDPTDNRKRVIVPILDVIKTL